MEFSRQEYWSGLPFSLPGIFPRIEPASLVSSALAVRFFTIRATWEALKWKCQSLSHDWFLVSPWMIAHQAPLSMEFPWREYWSGLPCPCPVDIPNLRTEPMSPASPALEADSLLSEPPGNMCETFCIVFGPESTLKVSVRYHDKDVRCCTYIKLWNLQTYFWQILLL